MAVDSVVAALPGSRGSSSRIEVPSAATGGFQIPSLDGIRAVAVMIVFVAHAGLQNVVPGGFGVTVFFFLSGYLITTLLRREYESTGGISLRAFYLRRVYRIFPPLYLVLGLLIAYGLFHEKTFSWTAALAQIFHLTNYYLIAWPAVEYAPVVPYTVPFWSLAVEEHFYLVFPVALLFLARRQPYHRIAAILFAGCVAVLAWRLAVFALLDNPGHYNYLATDARLDSLLYGCIMGMWLNPALDPAPKVIGPRGWLAICAAALGLIAASFLVRSEVFREAWRYSVQGIALFPLFYCAIRYSRSPAFAWLNARPVRALGIVSYTFYLSHFAAIQFAGKALGSEGLARGLLGFAFAAAFSAASYILIEKRFAALRHKLHR